MPLIIGIDTDFTFKDPLGLYPKSPGLDGAPAERPIEKPVEQAPARESLPAGMRNNNPGNIKYRADVPWEGLVGPSVNTDQGDPQAVFDTPEKGMRATYKLALNKYKAGKRTAADLIAGEGGWTPGNSQAAANIARTMGLAPTDDLQLDDPAQAQKFLRALVTQEHGQASQAYGDEMISGTISAFQSEAPTPFDKVLAKVPGDPDAKGLARLAPPEADAPKGAGGRLVFAHKGQDKLEPGFTSILTDVSAAMGRDFTITSGYRSAAHPVEARKKGGPGEHSRHQASDISMRGMSEPERVRLVQELRARGVKRFGIYKDSPDMLHVDMKDQTGDGTPWFMYDTTNKKLGRAPKWFQDIAAGKAQAIDASTTAGIKEKKSGGVIVMDDAFKPADGMGMYRDGKNPFAPAPAPIEEPAAVPAQSVAPPVADPADAALADLNAKEPGRYQAVDAASYEKWKADWEAKNRSTGVAGDAKRLLASGWAGLGLAAREVVGAIPKVGPSIVSGLDSVDEWMRGDDVSAEQYLQRNIQKNAASLTPETATSRGKEWVTEQDLGDGKVKYGIGPAWKDPRSYFSGLVESIPGTVIGMGPGMILAKGAYTSALVKGATTKQAAAAAARTATIAGAISEGTLGGGQAARSVRDQIAAMPRQALEQSEAVQQLVAGGATFDEAVQTLTDDAASQALVIAGVATGAFGGMGDRVLAKILAEGVGGGIGKRIISGGVRGAVAEGVLEELPQEAAGQLAQNKALQTIDPSQSLTEGVANAAAGGLAVGATMGAGFGGAGGAASRAEEVQAPAAPVQPAGPPAPRRGPLAGALDHAERRTTEAQGGGFIIKDGPIGDMPAGPMDGKRVQVAPDQTGVPSGMKRVVGEDGAATVVGDKLLAPEKVPSLTKRPREGSTVRVDAPGIEPFMARVESFDGDEALVYDSGSGEIYQVPIDALTEIGRPLAETEERNTPSPTPASTAEPATAAEPPPSVITGGMRKRLGELGHDNTQIREMSPETARNIIRAADNPVAVDENDPALEPPAPAAPEKASELPPQEELKPAREAFPSSPPPGARVIVNEPGVGRFSGRIEHYENVDGKTEVVVVDDAGTSMQVPLDKLYVSKLTKKEVEAQDLARDPPVEREPTQEETGRKIGDKTVVMPDAKHARLFDLGKNRMTSKILSGVSKLDMDQAFPAEQSKLAAEFGVTPEALGQMSDDYRYRVERAGKEARSKLPVKMHPVNERRLRQWQADSRKQNPQAEPSDDLATWWDGELTALERKAILDKTGVKRSEKMTWRNMSGPIREKLKAAKVENNDLTPAIKLTEVLDTAAVDAAVHEAATSPQNDLPEPTQAQKEAGNYKVGRMRVAGLDISIENPEGSERKGGSKAGKAWSVKMKSHYGYIRGTVGKDKDHIDVFVNPRRATAMGDTSPVFVIDQVNNGKFDEHKVMVGFGSRDEAEEAYRENYTKGWKGLGAITPTTMGDFKGWLESGDTTQPFAETRLSRPTPKPLKRTDWSGTIKSLEAAVGDWPAGSMVHGKLDLAKRIQGLTDAEWARVEPYFSRDMEPGVTLEPEKGLAVIDQALNAQSKEARKPASDPIAAIHNELADRISPKEFVAGLSNDQTAAVIDPQGKLWVLKASTNPAGDHAEFFGRLIEADLVPHDKTGYVRVTAYSNQIGTVHDGQLTVPQTATIGALKAFASRAAVNVVGDTPAQAESQKARKPDAQKPAQNIPEIIPEVTKPAWGSGNKLVTADRAEELRKRLREKLRGQLSAGIDPELLAMGTELAAFHIEAGARRFADFARAIAADMGTSVEKLRPFLRAWYNGARDLMEDSGVDIGGTDDAETVRAELAKLTEEGQADEPSELGQPGPTTLAGAPAEPLRRAERSRNAGKQPAGSGEPDLFGGEPTRAERVPAGRGVADGAGELPSPAARTPAREAASPVAVASDDAGDAGRPARDADRVEYPPSAATPAAQRAVEYTLSDADDLGSGGAKTKFRQNVAAIRLLRTLDAAARPATRDEQSVLAKWVGWGGLRPAFAREDGSVAKGWDKEAAELKELLTPEEYRAAESSTRNAHYTSPEVVRAIWDIARRVGFTGGRVLEPSVGAGNFIGLMPAEWKPTAHFSGVELDHITGGIAKNLYPAANIQAPRGFQDLALPDGYFDLVIGNPPFGSERLYDADRRHLNKFSIHNFFFAKSIEALKPNGVLAMVVTNYFLDAADAKARAFIAARADLLGAIRLPNNAFLKNAGTEVTTDIIVLKKRAEGAPASDLSWVEAATYKDKEGRTVPLNRYFKRHPEMMLGEFGAYGTMYRGDEAALVARADDDLSTLLRNATLALPENVMDPPGAAVVPETVVVPDTVEDAIVGSLFLSADGAVFQRKPDSIGKPQADPVSFPNETAKERVAGMIRVRDAFARLRRAQIDDSATDFIIDNLRKLLNQNYDAFVKKQGPINADANKRLFRDDPTWPQISALEEGFDKGISATVAKATGEAARGPSAKKAPIFVKRTQQPYKRPTSAASAKDALATVLADRGRVDLTEMTKLYRKSERQIVDELGSLLYRTPDGAYETADAYLSGNVKAKLAEAQRAAELDPDFKRNIAALRDIIPADIEPVDIDVKPGAPWLPKAHVADFINHITEAAGAKAHYSPANAKWAIDVPRAAPAVDVQWSTDRTSLASILEAVLNGQSITVYDRTSDGKSVLNQPATDAANEKAEKVKAEWRRWLWQEDSRRDELARLYNDTFNTDVLRTFDGSHLTLPGKVSDDIITFRPHQKNFVWRALQSSTTLADHVVGSGKTFELIATIMEMRRTGMARKPMLTVPNHLVGQWAADFIKLYPGAKVLAATKRDFEAENRKRLFARVATGDWDVVIVAHSSFGRIGVSQEFEEKFIREQMDALEASITELRAATGEKSRSVSQLAKWRENLENKLKRLLDAGAKDEGMSFEEMGLDALFVDEAHEFKNLAFATSMTRVAGLGNAAGSQKASDLYMKVQSVLERTGGRNIVFATGTPLSNTMAEMYTVQRYLDGKALKDLGVAHFDAWARVFGEVVSDWELSPSGQYKLNSRFAKFVNMPELMQRYLSFADVITNDDIRAQMAALGKTLPLPRVKGGKPQNVVVERSADQATYIGVGKTDAWGNLAFPAGSLVFRAENLPKKAEKGADNMLKVMSDARKAALDMRLIDPSYPDVRGSKVHVAADNIKRIYDGWEAKKGTQLVFIDLSTPKKAKAKEQKRIQDLMKRASEGDEAAIEAVDNMSPDEFLALDSSFSVYDDLREKLIARGIAPAEIAFIHDANTDAQKEELFGKVRSGRVRVLLGSTPKMGAGTNVQNRLVALHHLDAPWRPSDLEQRDGRGIRQGNELYGEDPEGFEIEILRYATKNTLDARQWQTIEGKARFIQQMRKGGTTSREIEDIAGEASNAAEMKAAASGNPLILEEMDLRQKLRKLEGQSTEHDREQHRIKMRASQLRNEMERNEKRMADAEADAALAGKLNGEFSAEIQGVAVEKPKDMGAGVLSIARKMLEDKQAEADLGTLGGFKLSIENNFLSTFTITISGTEQHDVHIEDVKAADPVGVGMRMINTVKRLVDEPNRLAERNVEIERQIPALEKQVAAWPDADKLAETAKRHAEVLTALRPKPQTAAPAPDVQASALPDAWWEGDTGDVPELSEADQQRVMDIVRDVSGLDEVTFAETIALPNGASGWGSNAPTTAGGYYRPDTDAITIALDAQSADRVAYHEAFHRLQRLFLTPAEKAILKAEVGRLRRIVGSAIGREAQASRMSQTELEAEAFAIYAAGGVIKPHKALRAAWDRISEMVRRVRNFLTGKGFQIGRDVFDQAKGGQVKARMPVAAGANGLQYSMAPDLTKRAMEEVWGKLTDLQPNILKTIPLNYFTELARPNMTAVGEYMRVKRLLDAYRGKKHAVADEVAQSWLKFARLGFGKDGKAKAAELASLMHDATIAGTDPSKTDEETRAKPDYVALRRRYTALPPAGRELFQRVRDAYSDQAAEMDKILLENVRKAQEIARQRAEDVYREEIERINATKMQPRKRKEALDEAEANYKAQSTRAQWSMKARLTKMRLAFEASRVEEPYFPLARFGRYFVSVRDVDGTVLSFSRREKAAERDRLAADMRAAYPGAKVEVGVVENSAEIRQAMDPRLIAEFEQIVGGAGLDSAMTSTVLDQIWQRYLTTMPDLSVRKRFIHRKGTAGFDADALRAFTSHMFHAAHQMGRLKYGLELQELTNRVTDQARKSDDVTRAMTLANELKSRHQWVMNPTGGRFAQTMTSAAFVWYLATSPASAIVNMTQTPMLGIPMLGGRFGSLPKAAAAILRASKDSVAGKGSVGRANLTREEQAAIEAFYESGLIDRTQSHDLAGVGETGVDYSPLRAKVMGVMSWMFHKAEVWNREVTALAAYRMAKASGQNHSDAVDTAHDLTWKTHFDYSNSSRPAVLQNDFAKVALVFRAHNINMLYRMFRDFRQAFKGETAQARAEARRQLAGVIGMMSLLAGARGVFAYSLIMAIAGALLGDDDDPMDFEEGFKKDVLDLLGPELGGVVLNGVPGHYLGVDLTARIGMPDLWFRSPTRDLQGKDEFEYYVMNSLGASVSLLGDMVSGLKMINEGNVAKGIETVSPKWVRDLMRAYRYSNEGVTNFSGDSIVAAEQIDPWDAIAQALGFTPAKIAETYDRNSALNNAESRVLRKRRVLINAFAMAVQLGDDEARAEALVAIKQFNAVPVNKPLAIGVDSLRQSLRVRDRNDKKREDGVLIENPQLGKRLREMLPDRVYD